MSNEMQLELPTVLIVEGDENLSVLYELFLKEHVAGIVFASGPEEASKLALKCRPAIIIVGCHDTYYGWPEVKSFVDNLSQSIPVLYCYAHDDFDLRQNIAASHEPGSYSMFDLLARGYKALPVALSAAIAARQN